MKSKTNFIFEAIKHVYDVISISVSGIWKRTFLKPHFVGVKKFLSISLVNLLQDGSKHSCYKLMSAFFGD